MMQNELAKFDHLKGRITEMLAPLANLRVLDKTDNAAAAGCLTTVKGLAKEIESLRVAAVTPLNEQVKAINARAKVIVEPLEIAEADIKTKMRVFADAETRRIQEERRKIDEAAALERKRVEDERRAREKAEEENRRAEAAFGVSREAEEKKRAEEERQARMAMELRESERHEANYRQKQKALDREKPTNTRTVWKFEIVEWQDVPQEFWIIDESKVGAAVRGGAREIPGVRIFSEMTVVAH